MRLAKLTVVAVGALAGIAVIAAACGGDDDEAGEAATPAPGTTAPAGDELAPQPEPPQAIADEVTEATDANIETELGDNFFVQNNLSVSLAETVTIRAVNNGLATHNLRVAGVDGEWNTDDDFVTDPDAIGSGQSGELEFAPPAAGTFTFRCDFHPTEMGGVIVVQ